VDKNYILFIQSSKANDGFTESEAVLAYQVPIHFIELLEVGARFSSSTTDYKAAFYLIALYFFSIVLTWSTDFIMFLAFNESERLTLKTGISFLAVATL